MKKKNRSAFTLLEMLFVIVIVGIIANIGVDVFKNSYTTYLTSNIENHIQTKTSLLTNQIKNLLENRIRGSVIISNSANGPFKSLTDANVDKNGKVIEWISVDSEGWDGLWDGTFNRPTWSGFIDLDHASHSNLKLVSPGTDTSKINTIITTLSVGTADINDSVLIFTGANSDVNRSFGWHYQVPIATQSNDVVHRIQSDVNSSIFAPIVGTTFTLTDVYEFYKLAWTAKALVIEADGNLTLYQNYQPWEGEIYSNGTATTMMEDVDTLKFKGVGDIIKFELCINTGPDNSPLVDGNYSYCKEQAVY